MLAFCQIKNKCIIFVVSRQCNLNYEKLFPHKYTGKPFLVIVNDVGWGITKHTFSYILC